MPRSELIDINGLEKDLAAAIEGEIRFGTGDRAMYASDAGNYRMVPIGVILPKSAEDIVQALRVCRSGSHARHRELLHPNPRAQQLDQTDVRLLTKAKDPEIRPGDIQAMVHAASFKRCRKTGSDTLAGYF
jgi:hypothetical protein